MSNPELDKLLKPSKAKRFFNFLLGLTLLAMILLVSWQIVNLTALKAWRLHVESMRNQGMELAAGPYVPPPTEDESNTFKNPTLESIARKDIPRTAAAQNLLSDAGPFQAGLRLTIEDLQSWEGEKSGWPTNSIPGPDARLDSPARFILNHFAPSASELEAIYAACNLPNSRIDLDYKDWAGEGSIPDFVALRKVGQNFALRARAHLALGDTQAALNDLNVLRRLALMSAGQPNTLVLGMIEIALTSLYVNVVEGALREGMLDAQACQEIQEHLNYFDVPAHFVFCVKTGEIRGINARILGHMRGKIKLDDDAGFKPFAYLPNGIVYRNLIAFGESAMTMIEGVDAKTGRIQPGKIEAAGDAAQERFESFSPSTMMANVLMPNLVKAANKAAEIQARIQMAKIGCALERFRLKHNVLPETLDQLVPNHLESVPADVVTGQPPIYKLLAADAYSLRSVGWNETDDGGNGAADEDWVWNGSRKTTTAARQLLERLEKQNPLPPAQPIAPLPKTEAKPAPALKPITVAPAPEPKSEPKSEL